MNKQVHDISMRPNKRKNSMKLHFRTNTFSLIIFKRNIFFQKFCLINLENICGSLHLSKHIVIFMRQMILYVTSNMLKC